MSQKAHVGFVINRLASGGAERVFTDDANMLAAAGYGVTLFVLYGEEADSPLAAELTSPISVRYLRAKGPYDAKAVSECAHFVLGQGVRVIFSTLNDGNIFARWVALRTGTRFFQREANTLASKTLWQRMLDFLFGWVPFRYLAVSSEVRGSLGRLVCYRRHSILLFPNAVTLPETSARGAHLVPHLLAVGRFAEQKDYTTLVHALALVKRSGTEFKATFIGDGHLRDDIERLVFDEGLGTSVTFTGFLPHNRVRETYQTADLFVLSSRWEGSPNALLEAMSYGLPCVSTGVGGVTDIMTDDKDGLLVPPGDPKRLAAAVESLLRNPELRERLGRAARERIDATFSQEARFKQLQALMEMP